MINIGERMKTIKCNIENILEIKNSKFITNIIKIKDSNIEPYLKKIKEKHPKATHHCYAFIIKEEKKASDDGEPSGTAGLPMLNVLEKEKLNNILVITTRYFGGIKLGAGGLVRAYTNSVTEALKKAEYVELIEGYEIILSFPYQSEKEINYLLKDAIILERRYQEQITYIVNIPIEIKEKLHSYDIQIIKNIYIEKTTSS